MDNITTQAESLDISSNLMMPSKFFASSEDHEDSRDDWDEDLEPDLDDQALVHATTSARNRSPSQHMGILLLSTSLNNCWTQAAKALNDARAQHEHLPMGHPDVADLALKTWEEYKTTLIDSKTIPAELADITPPELQPYSASLNTALASIAGKLVHNVTEPPAHRTIRNARSRGNETGSTTASLSEDSQALVQYDPQQNFNSLQAPRGAGGFVQPSVFSRFFPSQLPSVQKSIFATEYTNVAELGEGGFGRVYLATNKLDGGQYAIKKIVVRAARLSSLRSAGKLEGLLSEIKTLARLDHHNIVRYNHAWLESRPCGEATDSDSSADESSDEVSDAALSSTGVESIFFEAESTLALSPRRPRIRTSTGGSFRNKESPELDMVVFAEDSHASHNEEYISDIEEIPRLDSFATEMNGHSRDNAGASSFDLLDKHATINFDAVIFIKMAAYPFSLEDYIWPDLERDGRPNITHCFHCRPTIGILLAILDGVEYIHRKKIIHRDLKPANVFLAILENEEPVTQGYVEVTGHCAAGVSDKPLYLSPRIGDFGLVHELKDLELAEHTRSPFEGVSVARPYPFSEEGKQLAHEVGTTMYCPPKMPTKKPIVCPKLDVYGLGMIALELSWKFDTKQERAHKLPKCKLGEFPQGFDQHPLADGIKEMLCPERDDRWDCARVRKWLLEKQAGLDS